MTDFMLFIWRTLAESKNLFASLPGTSISQLRAKCWPEKRQTIERKVRKGSREAELPWRSEHGAGSKQAFELAGTGLAEPLPFVQLS